MNKENHVNIKLSELTLKIIRLFLNWTRVFARKNTHVDDILTVSGSQFVKNYLLIQFR